VTIYRNKKDDQRHVNSEEGYGDIAERNKRGGGENNFPGLPRNLVIEGLSIDSVF
jgi:hypothetical protein